MDASLWGVVADAAIGGPERQPNAASPAGVWRSIGRLADRRVGEVQGRINPTGSALIYSSLRESVPVCPPNLPRTSGIVVHSPSTYKILTIIRAAQHDQS